MKIWTALADRGYVKAQNNLGTMYSQGKGVSRNYPLAVFWYRRSAAQGDARAMYNIGIAYEYGRGVDRNHATALDWYSRAAAKGVVEAVNAMASLFANSTDPNVRDGQQAVRWAEIAVSRRTSSRNLETLAVAYAAVGQYARAVSTIDRAIDFLKRELNGADMAQTDRDLFLLVRREGRTDSVAKLLERQEFYRQGLPFRD